MVAIKKTGRTFKVAALILSGMLLMTFALACGAKKETASSGGTVTWIKSLISVVDSGNNPIGSANVDLYRNCACTCADKVSYTTGSSGTVIVQAAKESGNILYYAQATASGTTANGTSACTQIALTESGTAYTLTIGGSGVDSTAPTGTISINAGNSTTPTTTVSVTLSVTDDTGVTGYYLSEYPIEPTASSAWQTIASTPSYTGTVAFALTNGDGSKTVYAWFIDGAGNISNMTSSTITLQTELTTLISGLSFPYAIAVDSAYVYWSENTSSGNIRKIGITGGTATTLASGLNYPADIAIDASYVYWAETASGTIKKVGLTGGNVTTLASGLSSPLGIAIDSTHVYWTENTYNGKVQKVGMSGGTPTQLASGLNYPAEIAVDGASAYWTENVTNGMVKKIGINGGVATTLASVAQSPEGIALDASNVYWAEFGGGTVKKVSISGGATTVIQSSVSGPKEIAVDASHVFFTSSNNTVSKVGLGGGTVTTLASTLNTPFKIAVDSSYVYFTEYSLSYGTIRKTSK